MPLSAAHTGTTCECSEQHTTGMPARDSASASSSPCGTAFCSDVYGSVITCAPGSGSRPRPRVRFTCTMSKPPLPSSSSRAWTFTTTSSPTSTGPVTREYAIQGTPSPWSRTSSGCGSTMAVTVPRLSESGIDQRQRHVDHRLEIVHRDPLVGAVDVDHSVSEIEALEAALVEDVRVRGAAAQDEAGLVLGPRESIGCDAHDVVAPLEAIAAV